MKVVILTGAGEAFTAGQDLAEMAQPAAGATGGEHSLGACLIASSTSTSRCSRR